MHEERHTQPRIFDLSELDSDELNNFIKGKRVDTDHSSAGLEILDLIGLGATALIILRLLTLYGPSILKGLAQR